MGLLYLLLGQGVGS